MTRNDIRVEFNKEKDLHVLQTEGTGYIHYTDDYVHWLEDIAIKQANGVATNQDQALNLADVTNSTLEIKPLDTKLSPHMERYLEEMQKAQQELEDSANKYLRIPAKYFK